jgi:hypothetical protein
MRLLRRTDAVLRAVDEAIKSEEAHSFLVAVVTMGLGLYKYNPCAKALELLDTAELTTEGIAAARRLIKEHYEPRISENSNTGTNGGENCPNVSGGRKVPEDTDITGRY